MKTKLAVLAVLLIVCVSSAVPGAFAAAAGKGDDSLVGAWRGKVQFTSGAFSGTKDLEFMYVFNVGGTMLESSNYDAAPPVPPAFGAWRKVGSRQYEAKYQFFLSKPAKTADEIVKGGGWGPGGYGILVEKLTLSADGQSFDSRMTLELFDKDGKPIAGGGEAIAKGQRTGF